MERLRKIIAVAAPLGVLGLGLVIGAYQVNTVDTPWHVRTGQWIVEHHAVPSTDFYSFTRAGMEWIDAQWLFQVVAWGWHAALGPSGLTVMMMVMIAALVALVASAAVGDPPPAVRAAAGLIFLIAANPRLLCRPELLSCLLLALMLFALERAARPRWLGLAALAQLLLVNAEGLWPLGVAVCAAMMLDRLVLSADRPRGPALRPWLLFGGFIAVSGFLQPYGLRGLAFPLTLLYEVTSPSAAHKSIIAEFQPLLGFPFIVRTALPFLVLAALTVAAVALAGRSRRWGLAALSAVMIGLALSARRNVGVAGVVCGHCLIVHLGIIWQRRSMPRAELAAGVAAAVVALALIPFMLQEPRVIDDTLREPGFGFSEKYLPVKAAEWLAASGYRGRIINNEGSGGYLIYRGWPEWQVFADSRFEVGGEYALLSYRDVFALPSTLPAYADRVGARALVIGTRSDEMRRFVRGVISAGGFDLAYQDERYVVLIRTVSAR